MKPQENKYFWITVSVAGIFFSVVAIVQTYSHIIGLVSNFWASKWLPFIFFELISLVLWIAVAVLAVKNQTMLDTLNFPIKKSVWLQMLGGIIFLFVSGIFVFIRFWMIGKDFNALFASFAILWILSVAATLGIRLITRRSFSFSFLVCLILFGIVFIVTPKIPQVTTYPFSLGWSEASRYYYGSLVFSEKLYGMQLPLSFMHPSRYLLQSIPFLINHLPLWFHRLWQVVLWLGCAGMSALFLVRRLRSRPLAQRIVVGLWFFVFLFQGAVYYHLLICVILVLAGYSREKPWKTILFVGLSSFWAGISRINWFPVPGMIAASFYLIEESLGKSKSIWKYLLKPVLWVVAGTLIAFASQAFYVLWSGNKNNLSSFGSSFFSDLVWYRLLPNPSFALGILPGILLVSLPFFVIIAFNQRIIFKKLHPIRGLGLLAILLVLFVGGLVVSVKVGGGGDLHNMDAYMVVLAISVVSICHSLIDFKPAIEMSRSYFWPAVILAVVIPITLLLGAVVPVSYDKEDASEVLKILDAVVTAVSSHGGRVLFITQRQLLTFGTIQGVTLIPEYEILTLNEMALSGDEKYLPGFYQDLDQHAYDLIVADYQYGRPKQRRYSFSEENDQWTLRAGRYLTCEYFPILTFKDVNIQLYLPRHSNPVCP